MKSTFFSISQEPRDVTPKAVPTRQLLKSIKSSKSRKSHRPELTENSRKYDALRQVRDYHRPPPPKELALRRKSASKSPAFSSKGYITYRDVSLPISPQKPRGLRVTVRQTLSEFSSDSCGDGKENHKRIFMSRDQSVLQCPPPKFDLTPVVGTGKAEQGKRRRPLQPKSLAQIL